MRQRVPVAVVMLLTVAAPVWSLTGCGSGHNTASSTAQPAGRAHYIALADGICRRGIASVEPVNSRAAEIERAGLSAPLEAEGLIPLVKQGAKLYRALVGRLRAVPEPHGDEASLAAIFAAHDRVAADLDHLAEVLEREEFKAVKTVTAERERDHDRAVKLERAYGFKVCGEE